MTKGDIVASRKKHLKELEDVIAKGFSTFIAVGNAIAKIHEDSLYLESSYGTFADYMDRRWGWTARHGYRQMQAAKIGKLLMDGNVTRGSHPNNERQIRPLTQLEEGQWVDAWNDAVYLANEERGLAEQPKKWRPPFEKHVRYVVNELLSDRRRSKPRNLIELGKFNIIYCDPPWRDDFSTSQSRATERFYPTMTMDGLFGMASDVREISAKNALMFMWTTPAFTRKAVLLMRMWGFEYRTNMVWVKPSIGTGQWVRQQHELLMIGRKGKFPTPDGSLRPPSVVNDKRRKHSEKPKVFREFIEQMYPDSPRIELFARNECKDWTVWGDEIVQI